jgi:hypothetical protein
MHVVLYRLSVLDGTLDRHQLAALWNIVDPTNLGAVEVSSIHRLLSDRFGKDKSAQKNYSVIDRVIKKILERCGEGAGIKGLSRYVYIFFVRIITFIYYSNILLLLNNK